MADVNVTLNPQLLPHLLSDEGEGLKKRIEFVLNPVLDVQVSEHLGADRHERTADRSGYRNGDRIRHLTIRIGSLTLRAG